MEALTLRLQQKIPRFEQFFSSGIHDRDRYVRCRWPWEQIKVGKTKSRNYKESSKTREKTFTVIWPPKKNLLKLEGQIWSEIMLIFHRSAFNIYDKDGSGDIELDEMVDIFCLIYTMQVFCILYLSHIEYVLNHQLAHLGRYWRRCEGSGRGGDSCVKTKK